MATSSTTTDSPRGSLIDPATLMRIKNLEVRARVVVEGFFSGLHRSPYHGFSVEFSEYREYSPGDDLRYLDWRLFGRSDRYYIKRFEDETNLRVHLLLDLSKSMGYGSVGYTKADYARTLAATIAYFLSIQRDAVGLLTFADGLGDYLPARYRPGHLRRMMVTLERAVSGANTSLTTPLEHAARIINKRGLIILVSDLLADVESLESHLGYLTSQGHEVIMVRILDPAELSFDFSDPAMFQDLESGRQLYVDPDSVRENYLSQFAEHEQQVRQACAHLGVDYQQMSTDEPLERALFDYLHSRLQRGKQPARVSRNQGGSR